MDSEWFLGYFSRGNDMALDTTGKITSKNLKTQDLPGTDKFGPGCGMLWRSIFGTLGK